MDKVKLYHYPLSFNSQLVRLALTERSIPWESQIVDIGSSHENFEPWYVTLNPRGEVPTAEFNGEVLTDSIAIAKRLDQALPGPKLVPSDHAELAEMEEWVELQQHFPERELAYATLTGFQGKGARKSIERQLVLLRRYHDANPQLREAYAAKLQEVEEAQRTVSDGQTAAQLIKRVEYMLDRLNNRVQGREWIVGDRYTLADVVWTVLLARLEYLKFAHLWQKGRRDAVAHYYDRVQSRPSFKHARIYPHPAPLVLLPSLLRGLRSRMLHGVRRESQSP